MMMMMMILSNRRALWSGLSTAEVGALLAAPADCGTSDAVAVGRRDYGTSLAYILMESGSCGLTD